MESGEEPGGKNGGGGGEGRRGHRRNEVYLLASPPPHLFNLFIQDHLLRGGSTHSEMGPPQANLVGMLFQSRVSLLR